ncbi:MAG: efflux RND transporter permease subunit [Symploca sp. SIO2E9]|nr:efflux RND transporter permease subunit [Symploca sp. SIO2E9]
MFSLFYRNFRLLILTVIIIVVWGLSSYQALPRLEDPELVSRLALVKTFFPGASAERVEALVTEKIEQELSEIEEIDTYKSTSRTGSSIIEIELLNRVTADEVDPIWSRIRDKLSDAKVEFPAGTTEPELDEIEVKAYSLITALTWEQDDPPNYAILLRSAELLEDQLRILKGTEKTEIFGDPEEEIVVEINPAELVTLGLTAQDLSQQIQQSDSKTAAGQLRGTDSDLLIEVDQELDSLDRVRRIPISFGNGSQFTNLGDIALVSKGTVEPLSDIAIISGHPAVTVGVFVESDYRLDQWAKQAHQVLKQFQEQLPSGLELKVVFDQSNYVEARLNKLIINLLFGALLVFGVTFLMMGWQSALIVGSALPLSILMVFGCMKLMGIPLHQMSVTGLIVALGILIDTAIVMVDEVQKHLKQGLKPEAAINKSVRYLAVPLLSSTITTILAFMPIALLPGSVGEFVGTIGLNVILAVSCSLFLSLTVIPALTARLHKYWQRRVARPSSNRSLRKPSSRPWWETGLSIPLLSSLYSSSVKLTTARPILGILFALTLPVAGFIGALNLELQFFPFADRDQLQIELELPSSASISQTQYFVKNIREQVISHPEVKDVHWFVGQNAPRFYYNLTGGRENESNYAQALVQLNSLSSSSLTRQLQAEMDETFPSARVVVRQFEQGPPFEAPVEMRIYGSDSKRLQELGERARALLVNVANVTHTRASLSEVLPQLGLRVDEEKARLAGLNNASIAQQLDTTLEGTVGGSILESTEELPVRVRLSNSDRGDLDQITSLDLLPVSPNLGSSSNSPTNLIPLSALGEVELKPEQAKITRYNGQRVNTLQAFITTGVLPSKVLSDFKQQLDSSGFQLPQGYSFEFGGEAQERAQALGGLTSAAGVLVVLTVATLVLSLSSFKLAGLIGVVAIASFGLGLFSVNFFGYPFGFNPIIGTIGLIGVAINDSIVVLSALLEDPEARRGNRKAVRSVVMHSTRHVLTTTLTTMIGFVPLLLDGGGFWPPLAVAIAGGVGGATLLALYLIPSAYLLLIGSGNKTAAKFRSNGYNLKTVAIPNIYRNL